MNSGDRSQGSHSIASQVTLLSYMVHSALLPLGILLLPSAFVVFYATVSHVPIMLWLGVPVFFLLLFGSLNILSSLSVDCCEPAEYSTGYIPSDGEKVFKRTGKRVTARTPRRFFSTRRKYAGIYSTGSAAYSTRYVELTSTYVGMYEQSSIILLTHDYYHRDCMWSRSSSAGCSSSAYPALWRAAYFTPSVVLKGRNRNNFREKQLTMIPKLSFEGQHLSMVASSYRSSSESWWVVSPCAGVKYSWTGSQELPLVD